MVQNLRDIEDLYRADTITSMASQLGHIHHRGPLPSGLRLTGHYMGDRVCGCDSGELLLLTELLPGADIALRELERELAAGSKQPERTFKAAAEPQPTESELAAARYLARCFGGSLDDQITKIRQGKR